MKRKREESFTVRSWQNMQETCSLSRRLWLRAGCSILILDKGQWLLVLLGIESAKQDGVVKGCSSKYPLVKTQGRWVVHSPPVTYPVISLPHSMFLTSRWSEVMTPSMRFVSMGSTCKFATASVVASISLCQAELLWLSGKSRMVRWAEYLTSSKWHVGLIAISLLGLSELRSYDLGYKSLLRSNHSILWAIAVLPFQTSSAPSASRADIRRDFNLDPHTSPTQLRHTDTGQ